MHTAAGIHSPTVYSAPVPTTHQLAATNYSGCCLECYLHRTNRTVIVSTDEHAWSAVSSDDPRACSEKKSNRTKNHHINIDDRPVFPSYLTG